MRNFLTTITLTLLLCGVAGAYDLTWDFNQPYTADAWTLGLWHFDEQPGDTTAYDSSGFGNDGVLSALPAPPLGPLDPNNTWAAAKFGNGLNTWYNSTTDRNEGTLTVAQAPAGNHSLDYNALSGFTIEFWMKARAVGVGNNVDYIFTKGTMSDGQIFYGDDGTGVNRLGWTCYVSGGWSTIYDTTHIPLNEWHHVTLTSDQSATDQTYSFYIDGNLSSTHVILPISVHSGTDLTLLGDPTAIGARLFLGQIDELRVSSINRMNPVSFSESKWYQPHDGTDTNAIALYHFDETTGTTAFDSRDTHDGTINGHTFDVYSSTDVADSVFGRSLYFDGQQGQTVVVPDDPSLDLASKFTIEAWIKPTQFGGGMRNIVYKVDDSGNNWPPYSMGLWGSALWCQFVTVNSAVTKSATVQNVIAPNRWQHVAMTFDKGQAVPGGGRPMIKIIINGREIAPDQYAFQEAPNSLGPNLSNGPVLIGMWDFNITPYVGWIDDLRISNIAMDFNPVGADVDVIDLDKVGADLDITFTSALYGIYTIKAGADLTDMANWPVVGGVTGALMNTSYSIVNAFLTAAPQQFYQVEEFAAVEQGYPVIADKAITVDADLSDWAAGDIVADRDNFFAVLDGRALPYEEIAVYAAYSAVDGAFYIGWQTVDQGAGEDFQIMLTEPGNRQFQVAVSGNDPVNDLLFYSTTGGIGYTPDLKLNTGGDTYTETDLAAAGGAFAQSVIGGVWTGEVKLPYSVISATYTFDAGDTRTMYFNRTRSGGVDLGTTNPGGRFWEWEHSTHYPAGVGVQR